LGLCIFFSEITPVIINGTLVKRFIKIKKSLQANGFIKVNRIKEKEAIESPMILIRLKYLITFFIEIRKRKLLSSTIGLKKTKNATTIFTLVGKMF